MAENYQPAPVFDTLGDESGAPFYDAVEPADFSKALLRYRSQHWAAQVGLGDLSDDAWVNHFARFTPLAENLPGPLALRYHGHQFRSYNADIGDGRGFLFAQLRDDQGRLLDLGTKGSGQTPYSRFGDGRLTLKGGVREILATEMLEALGVYTSKTFSLIETGDQLHRDDEPSPARGAVMVRLSHSHVRFGAFQRLAYEKDEQAIGDLVDYCIRYFYQAIKTDGPQRVIDFYAAVVARTARLAAQWMAAGFVHGVLNTDNMNVTGESFDYGPWRFAPTADPGFTAAYFDQTGLYAFGRQPEACAWNLAQFGGALSLLAPPDDLSAILQNYATHYEAAMAGEYFRRFGLKRTGTSDFDTVGHILSWMNETGAPYEQVFFDWFGGPVSEARAADSPIKELYDQEKFATIKELFLAATPVKPERLTHDYFTSRKPQTMLIDEVEAMWAPIAEGDDWSLFDAKLVAIAAMSEAYGFEASAF